MSIKTPPLPKFSVKTIKEVFSNQIFLALFICLLFFIAYSTLSIVRHAHYQSFGYDLGINDQTVWKYSKFRAPINTIHPLVGSSKLDTHVELIYALISPLYWIWSSRQMLLLLQAAAVSFSGLFIFLLTRKYKLHAVAGFGVLISYLSFYGIQNALWFDVHSTPFATAALAGYIYFLHTKKKLLTILFLILAVVSKENIAILTFIISTMHYLLKKEKIALVGMLISFFYLVFIFAAFFPFILKRGYFYGGGKGILSSIDPLIFVNTREKQQVFFYTLATFGFLPIFAPLALLPSLGDLYTYFVFARDMSSTHGLNMHYRVTLAPLVAFATIVAVSKVSKFFRLSPKKTKLFSIIIGIYLLACTAAVQYALHLPLSYLSKKWFWTEPSGVRHINAIKKYVPKNASIVSQNNITPHLSHRDQIYTLFPDKKSFYENSPCGDVTCNWFRWAGNPEFLIVDTSAEWDIRHFLANREEFIKSLENLEKGGVVKRFKESQTAILYKVLKKP